MSVFIFLLGGRGHLSRWVFDPQQQTFFRALIHLKRTFYICMLFSLFSVHLECKKKKGKKQIVRKKKREGKYEWGESIPPQKCLDAHFFFFFGWCTASCWVNEMKMGSLLFLQSVKRSLLFRPPPRFRPSFLSLTTDEMKPTRGGTWPKYCIIFI